MANIIVERLPGLSGARLLKDGQCSLWLKYDPVLGENYVHVRDDWADVGYDLYAEKDLTLAVEAARAFMYGEWDNASEFRALPLSAQVAVIERGEDG